MSLAGVVAGDPAALQSLASALRAERIVLALAEPDPAARRLNVTIAGRDAVGPLVLKRRYRIDPDDFAYSLELAAVISLGVIEGRWKAKNTTSSAASDGGLQEVQIWVEFRNLGQWNQRQRVLSELPGSKPCERADSQRMVPASCCAIPVARNGSGPRSPARV